MAAATAYALLFLERWGIRYLEHFFQLLVAVMSVSFGGWGGVWGRHLAAGRSNLYAQVCFCAAASKAITVVGTTPTTCRCTVINALSWCLCRLHVFQRRHPIS